MADPLRHDSKLDIADEILDFIANNSKAEEIRLKIIGLLDLSEEDLEDAAEVVADFKNLYKNQRY